MSPRHLVGSAVALFRSRWWTIGWLVALGAWLLHVGALALAPLSTVQAVLSGGLVFLAVLAERYFGFKLERRQWAGLTITSVGLAVIGITSASTGADGSSLGALIAVEAGAFGLGALVVLGSMWIDLSRRREGMALGIAAGALFGVSDIAIKYLTRRGEHRRHHGRDPRLPRHGRVRLGGDHRALRRVRARDRRRRAHACSHADDQR